MRTSACKRDRRTPIRRGFSLIEITIALAIVASLTVVVAVSFAPASERIRLRAEVREIAGLLGEQRTRAITARTATVIDLDTRQNRIMYGEPPSMRSLPPNMTLRVAGENQHRRIVFFPEGGANGGSFVVADRQRSVVISVDWLTGRISIGEDVAHAG